MSGYRSIAPAALLDKELRLACDTTLDAWLEANAMTSQMLLDALSGEDRFGVLEALAAELGVTPESLPRAA